MNDARGILPLRHGRLYRQVKRHSAFLDKALSDLPAYDMRLRRGLHASHLKHLLATELISPRTIAWQEGASRHFIRAKIVILAMLSITE